VANETARKLLGRVRELREARGLTQEAFAERAGFTYKYYQSLEAGRKIDFRMSTLQKLARAFALEPWELLHPDTTPLAVGEGPNEKPDYGPGRKRRSR
jgi:transcriptional regulator with XRE-family HTH domain